jgi:hypothetical protein
MEATVLMAVVGMPLDADARKRAAVALELAPADLNRRLAGTLPRVLASGLSPERAARIGAELDRLGFTVITCDPAAAPGDDERVVARRVDFADRALVVTDAPGNTHTCSPEEMGLFQRGIRRSRRSTKVTTSERRFAPGKALLSGGLLLTKKVDKTTVKTSESQEAFLLIQRTDGEPDIIIYERRVNFGSLGPAMLPSSRGNLDLVWQQLCAMAPAVATDDRVAQPTFVSGLPVTRTDPVDLALLLVALARLKEGSPPR